MSTTKLELLIELSKQRLAALTTPDMEVFSKVDLILSMRDYIRLALPHLEELREMKTPAKDVSLSEAIQAGILDAPMENQVQASV
jgi:hypothetical protein